MHECIAARPLFAADNPRDIALKIAKAPAPKLSDLVSGVHPRLEAACARALSKSPADRFQSAREMSAEIRGYLADIGFDAGQGPVGSLVRGRFSDRIPRRERAVKAVLNGGGNESEFLAAFFARPVYEIDLFPPMPPSRSELHNDEGWWVDLEDARKDDPMNHLGGDDLESTAAAVFTIADDNATIDASEAIEASVIRKYAQQAMLTRTPAESAVRAYLQELASDEATIQRDGSSSNLVAIPDEPLSDDHLDQTREISADSIEDIRSSPPEELDKTASVRLHSPVGIVTEHGGRGVTLPLGLVLLLFSAGVVFGLGLGLGLAWLFVLSGGA